MYQFVIDINERFASLINYEFIGGQDKLIILYCSISVFASEFMKNNVESFFSLPLLTRIDNSVFEMAASEVFDEKTDVKSILVLSLFPSSFSVFDNLKKPYLSSPHLSSKIVVNSTKTSCRFAFPLLSLDISDLVHSMYSQQHSTHLRSLQSTETTLSDYYHYHNMNIESIKENPNSYKIAGDYSAILSTIVPLTDHLPIHDIHVFSYPRLKDEEPRIL